MIRKIFICFILCFFPLTAEQPWGKDADLVHQRNQKTTSCPSTLSSGASKLIERYQQIISPADGPRSHFRPTSSQYTKESIQKYGFFKGWIMGCDRLMRENNEEWVYKTTYTKKGHCIKSDPVR